MREAIAARLQTLLQRRGLTRQRPRMTPPLAATALALLGSFQGAAHALSATVTPQREAIAVRFDAAVVRLGDAQSTPPYALQCTGGTPPKSQGRWLGSTEWVLQFEQSLPPGMDCTLQPNPAFKPQNAGNWAPRPHRFLTGHPELTRIAPQEYIPIDEQQYFLLKFNTPVTAASVQSSSWCEVQGFGERIPVQLIEGNERNEVIEQRRWHDTPPPAELQNAQLSALHVLRCNRRLPTAAEVALVVGRGVSMASGVASNEAFAHRYTVQSPFEMEQRCQRENAKAGCLPLSRIELNFSAPVPWGQAQKIRLTGPSKHEPQLDSDASKDANALVERIFFAPPFAEQSAFKIEVPADLKDAAGRPLQNAAAFPLALQTGRMPTLLKFAAAPFGILERHGEGPNQPALLPLTVRGVESVLNAQSLTAGASMQHMALSKDADIIDWLLRVAQYDNPLVPRSVLAKDVPGAQPPHLPETEDAPSAVPPEYVESRVVSLLQGQPNVQTLKLPDSDANPRGFEVIGLPLPAGFHVVEIQSPMLGQALLDPRYGPQRSMVVRTSALVSNLAVHTKLGRENAMVWVTSLDQGKPVANAKVQVNSCDGKVITQGVSNAQGVVMFEGLHPQAPDCTQREEVYNPSGYFISARTGSGNDADLGFTWTSWENGIESWRFGHNTSSEPERSRALHVVFDRTLVRAGETVSMKLYGRALSAQGFAKPQQLPRSVLVRHSGSDKEYTLPLLWRSNAEGGSSATAQLSLPKQAQLGTYGVVDATSGEWLGSFQVSDFRLPVMQGQVRLGDAAQTTALIAGKNVPVRLQANYLSSGPAAGLHMQLSAMLRPHTPSFDDYREFSFAPPADFQRNAHSADDDYEEHASGSSEEIIANRQAVQLDAQGQTSTTIALPAMAATPRRLLVEANYQDPNGETQTLSRTETLWPANVVAGIRTPDWVSIKQHMQFDALAISPQGKPSPNTQVHVKAIARSVTSTRKRLVGGFYGYDSQTQEKELGTICSGKTDAQGLLSCRTQLEHTGELLLVAVASDEAGRESQAATSIWVTQQGEIWFGGENHDRMDVLPEKRDYQAGDTAVFQVRMPFREATALVTVEREGVLHSEVVTISGKDPSVRLKVQPHWGPNVYVSVLALRGRLYDVPWYSFFTWGYKTPVSWWRAFWNKSDEHVAPTAMIDLSKPAYRLGVAKIRVGHEGHALQVSVQADQPRYDVRGQAKVKIRATLPDGKPAAHAEVALAAVDQALLELQPNHSWKLLDAMMQERAWGVNTATAQMEIVGRRHYGRKALPAGGDGGMGRDTRELFDTLLLWQPNIELDAKGEAEVTVPLNDSLTTFTIAAVADSGLSLFGTGQTQIRTTQDLQVISGVPPLVRSGDQFEAGITVRNTTDAPMQVKLTVQAAGIAPEPRDVALAAGQSQRMTWQVTAPPMREGGEQAWPWRIDAVDSQQGAKDSLTLNTQLRAAQPVVVQQAVLQQVTAPLSLSVQAPANALRNAQDRPMGGVQVQASAKLADNLGALQDWWRQYPHTCLEQRSSKAIGLRDAALWQAAMADLPTHIANDGLPTYFPAGSGSRGSDALAAYLLTVSHEQMARDPRFQIPAAELARLQSGLIQFVEGRITPNSWSPRPSLDLGVRKIVAIEALSRWGKAQPRMLDSIELQVSQWPTHGLISWISLLGRMPGVPNQAALLAQAREALQSRLSLQGTRIVFNTEAEDNWFWSMNNPNSNAARLLALALQDPVLQADAPRLATGLMGRSQRGHWGTTTANAWAKLALDGFSERFEKDPVMGQLSLSLAPDSQSTQIDWAQLAVQTKPSSGTPTAASDIRSALAANERLLPWAASGSPQTLRIAQNGSGQPWVTVQSRAAVPRTEAVHQGFSVKKHMQVLEGGAFQVGAVVRVRLEVSSSAPMTWVAVSDPIPAGASLLGSGLARDSLVATQGESNSRAPDFVERAFDAWRGYYSYLPQGTLQIEYTMRLNNAGVFQMPPTLVEALYAPDMLGESPNAAMTIK